MMHYRSFACLAVLIAAPLTPVFAKPPTPAGQEVITHASGFGIDIPGCADASKNIREIAIDELNIDARELTTGMDVDYRLYGPGQPHWGSAKFTSAGGSKELQAWWQEAAKGKNIRKNITVTLFKSDKSPGRSYSLIDCLPTSATETVDEVHKEVVETVIVSIGKIEFPPPIAVPTPNIPVPLAKAEATSSDKFAQVRGFKVEITGAGGKEVDNAWESVSGGEMIIELTETTTGSDKFKTNSPGHKTVGEITLRGAMTDGRKAMYTWINDTTSGKKWKRMLTITELLSVDGAVKPGKAYEYKDCFPIRYVFPRLSIYDKDGTVTEGLVCKVIRKVKEIPTGAIGALDIPVAPEASADALLLRLDDRALDLSLIELTGDARCPTARITVPLGSGSDLHEWFEKAQKGLAENTTITVTLKKKGKLLPQSWILGDCSPAEYNFDTSSTVQTETLTVKIGRIEFKT